MSDAGVPIVPGTKDPIKNIDDLYKTADNVGFPVMLKAVAGGGGKGMRLVHKREDLEDMFNMAVSEAERAFGNGDVYIEKYVEEPHHVEVQVIGDKHGNVIHLYDRECSIQRRHQKVIEEAPSPYISQETRQKMLEVSVNACKKIGYYSAGTLEYMVDKNQNFYFLEMNTRLQVEHPVTEMITGDAALDCYLLQTEMYYLINKMKLSDRDMLLNAVSMQKTQKTALYLHLVLLLFTNHLQEEMFV